MTDLYQNGNVRIRPSIHWDIERMKDGIRESDRAEIEASHNQTPYEALSYGMRHASFCATVLYEGNPVAMFGTVPDMKPAGTVWLLATNDVYKMRYTFLKLSKRFVKLMMGRYPVLFNFVDARNKITIKWLEWIGAKVGPPKPYGIQGLPFHYFEFSKDVN